MTDNNNSTEQTERKVPWWAIAIVVVCFLAFIGLFLAFAASVSGGAG